MARNIEIKATLTDDQFQSIKSIAANIANPNVEILIQEDTFFNCKNGRLKLRQFADGSGELISYQRPDQQGPKASSYVRSPSPDPQSLLTALANSLGIRGIVRKRRELFLVDQTRIHLDEVDRLGKFIELEVVLDSGQTDQFGQTMAHDLMLQLGVNQNDLLDVAYIDLLERQTEK